GGVARRLDRTRAGALLAVRVRIGAASPSAAFRQVRAEALALPAEPPSHRASAGSLMDTLKAEPAPADGDRAGVRAAEPRRPPPARTPLPPAPRDAECVFYRDYRWCLNPFPTVGDVVGRLAHELERLTEVKEGW